MLNKDGSVENGYEDPWRNIFRFYILWDAKILLDDNNKIKQKKNGN